MDVEVARLRALEVAQSRAIFGSTITELLRDAQRIFDWLCGEDVETVVIPIAIGTGATGASTVEEARRSLADPVKGDKGDTGAPGAEGLKGQKGEPGEKVFIPLPGFPAEPYEPYRDHPWRTLTTGDPWRCDHTATAQNFGSLSEQPIVSDDEWKPLIGRGR